MQSWTPDSWKNKKIKQGFPYEDEAELESVLERLRRLPPLVTSWEVESLKKNIAEAIEGKQFLLQGGDCAETFDGCTSKQITSKLKILLKMGLILTYGCQKKIIRVGRFCGQYCKPRSKEWETHDGLTLPAYRGNMINHPAFTPEARRCDPKLLLEGYYHSTMTLNFIRSLVDGGFADIYHPELWDLDFLDLAQSNDDYKKIIDSISESIRFMETIAGHLDDLSRTTFYCSHEGLHLNYEQAHTRLVPRRPKFYNLSSHLPWIGDRTRNLDGAHVEFFRGIANPVGLKVGPTMEPQELVELCKTLNPENEPGKLVLIHRFGVNAIQQHLPQFIKAAKREKLAILWTCDPMHGNTYVTENGIKTRYFEDILGELRLAFVIHHSEGSYLGGVHFELTGENVTECIGGSRGPTEADLVKDYQSDVDPRLNYEQALEMTLQIARYMKDAARGSGKRKMERGKRTAEMERGKLKILLTDD